MRTNPSSRNQTPLLGIAWRAWLCGWGLSRLPSENWDPAESSAKLSKALRHTLKPVPDYVINDELISTVIREVKQRTVATMDTDCTDVSPQFTTDEHDLDLPHRCGRSFEFSQAEAERTLSTRWIYDAMETRGRYLTPFYVHRAIFRAFFGDEKSRLIPSDATHPNQRSPTCSDAERGPQVSASSESHQSNRGQPESTSNEVVLDPSNAEDRSNARDETYDETVNQCTDYGNFNGTSTFAVSAVVRHAAMEQPVPPTSSLRESVRSWYPDGDLASNSGTEHLSIARGSAMRLIAVSGLRSQPQADTRKPQDRQN